MNYRKIIIKNLDIIEDCLNDIKRYDMDLFERKRKNIIVECRRLLMNIIHVSKQLRNDFNEYHKSLPIGKKNISKEKLIKAKEKRQKTIAENKKKGKKDDKN